MGTTVIQKDEYILMVNIPPQLIADDAVGLLYKKY
jgi:hypothetical protein